MAERTEIFQPYLLSTSGEYSHAAGLSNAFSQSPDYLGGGNPAGPVAPQGLAAGIRWNASTPESNKFDEAIKSKYQHPYFPVAAGIVYSGPSVLLGLTYHQSSNMRIEFPPYTAKTISQPQGTGEVFQPVLSEVIYSIGANVAYSQSGLAKNSDKVTIGLQVNYNLWKFLTNSVPTLEEKFSDGSVSWKLGIHYAFLPLIATGLYYQPMQKYEDSRKQTFIIDIPAPDTVETVIHYTRRLPARWMWNTTVQSEKGLGISISLQYVYWKKMEKQFKNRLEYALGIQYPVVSSLNTVIGIYHISHQFALGSVVTRAIEDINFLTLAVEYRWQALRWRLELFDSHLLDSDYEFTRASFGVVYAFH